MIAISFPSSLASLPHRLTDPGNLKIPAPAKHQLAIFPIVLLLLWTTASIVLVLRSRSRQNSAQPQVSREFEQEILSVVKGRGPTNSTTNLGENHKFTGTTYLGFSTKIMMAMLLMIPSFLLLLGHVRLICALHDGYQAVERSSTQASDSTSLLNVFQVYQPVSFATHGENGCDLDMLLMDHVFGASYGKPFVGLYEPPSCQFDTVRINLTVTSRGRQYDRLALMYLGDNEVFRTSTAEPTTTGIVWTYIKDMSQYTALWKQSQTLIFDLGNIITDVYTGSFNATLTAHFSYEKNVKTADIILPISAKNSASNSSSAFNVPTDNTTVSYVIPDAASRAVVAISACGQSQEEFWWSNVFTQDTEDFTNTVGELYGFSPFREIQLYIDGLLAGLVWPFPIIFTGGVAPGFWRPIVGIDAFDLRQPEIDISPFLPMLQDGQEHSFEIRVTGLNISNDGTATLANTVGSYWVVTGNIFLYTESTTSSKDLSSRGAAAAPRIEVPEPKFTVTRNLVQNNTDGNETLSYSVVAERTFKTISSQFEWSQTLSFSNYGYLNQQGYSQVNKQLTSGEFTISESGNGSGSNKTSFSYPLLVNATYGITDTSLTIDAWMKRGLDIESSGGPGISTYSLVSGPSQLHTTQSGKARYKSVSGSATSSGNTADEFHGTAYGKSYSRSARAVNGNVVYDTNPGDNTLSSAFHSTNTLGRGSVRSMLGRGPGNSAP